MGVNKMANERPTIPPITDNDQLPSLGIEDQEQTKQRPFPIEFDVRAPNFRMNYPQKYGRGMVVMGVEEMLRRGFKALDDDEKANVVAAFLINQKEQLSVFETEDELQERQERLQMDKSNHKLSTIIKYGTWAIVIIALTTFMYYIITGASKGVMNDSGLFQGIITMIKELVPIVLSGGGLSN